MPRCDNPDHTRRYQMPGAKSDICGDCKAARERRARQRLYQHRKRVVLRHYGEHCACCGETDESILVLPRKGARIPNAVRGRSPWERVITAGFPDDLFILCEPCRDHWCEPEFEPYERNGKLVVHYCYREA